MKLDVSDRGRVTSQMSVSQISERRDFRCVIFGAIIGKGPGHVFGTFFCVLPRFFVCQQNVVCRGVLALSELIL